MTQRTRLTGKKAGEQMSGPLDATQENNTGDAFAKKYDIGGPSEFGEDPISTQETKALHDKDVKERNDMNIGELRLAFANEIRSSKNVREHAAKCVTASECMLPGANEEVITANATDLMFLPDFALDGILSRQAALAEDVLQSAKEEGEEKKAGDEKAEEGDEKKAGEAEEKAEEGEEKKAGEAEEKADEGDEKKAGEEKAEEGDEKLAALEATVASLKAELEALKQKPADEAPAMENEPAMDMGDDADEGMEGEEAPAVEGDEGEMEITFGEEDGAGEEEGEEGEGTAKTASSQDLLASIFQAYEPAPSQMSAGMVRKASAARSEEDELAAVWGTTPDVSHVFAK